MYSGITQGLFPVTSLEKKPGILFYSVRFTPQFIENLQIGASVNINGVCQTVTAIENETASFAAMAETLRMTTLKELQKDQNVSAERSLRFGEEIGGHLIAGHVIGTAMVDAINRSENNLNLVLRCKKEWMKYIFPKGFIAVDGSSLTVGETDPAGTFTLNLIPETLRLTNFGNKKIGDTVNIELDHSTQVIVDTVERLQQFPVEQCHREKPADEQ